MNTHQSATNQEIEDKTDDGSLTGPNASACCSIEEQERCCEPSEYGACCGSEANKQPGDC